MSTARQKKRKIDVRLDLVRSDLYRIARDGGNKPNIRIAAARVLLHYPAEEQAAGPSQELLNQLHRALKDEDQSNAAISSRSSRSSIPSVSNPRAGGSGAGADAPEPDSMFDDGSIEPVEDSIAEFSDDFFKDSSASVQ